MQECHCSDFLARVRECAVELRNFPPLILWSSDWRFFKNNNLNAVCPVLSRATFPADHRSRVVVTESVNIVPLLCFTRIHSEGYKTQPYSTTLFTPYILLNY